MWLANLDPDLQTRVFVFVHTNPDFPQHDLLVKPDPELPTNGFLVSRATLIKDHWLLAFAGMLKALPLIQVLM